MKTTTAAPELTITDLELGYYDPLWLGHGYLGARKDAMCTEAGRLEARTADAYLLDVANADGWTLVELFDFVNSKPGRWYGEAAFHGGSIEEAKRLVRRIR